MKLSRASNYAVQALAHMAGESPGSPAASHLVAEARGIPKHFLLKVLKPLVDARVLHSLKGPHGGYRLARAPKDITLLEVVEAVDGPIRSEAPEVGKNGGAALDRRLQHVCDGAAALTRQRLAKTTLADLMRAR